MIEETQQDIVMYQSTDGAVEFGVNVFEDTVWLTQKQMAELFDTTVANINIHLKNCYAEEEIAFYPTIKDFLIVRQEGSRSVTRKVSHYSLDAILSIGYRIKSARATQFRRWATKVLKQYMLQGYAANAVRLSNIEKRLVRLQAQRFTMMPCQQI